MNLTNVCNYMEASTTTIDDFRQAPYSCKSSEVYEKWKKQFFDYLENKGLEENFDSVFFQ